MLEAENIPDENRLSIRNISAIAVLHSEVMQKLPDTITKCEVLSLALCALISRIITNYSNETEVAALRKDMLTAVGKDFDSIIDARRALKTVQSIIS